MQKNSFNLTKTDIVLVAQSAGVSADMVRKVARGERKSKKVSDALNIIDRARKTADKKVAKILESLEKIEQEVTL